MYRMSPRAALPALLLVAWFSFVGSGAAQGGPPRLLPPPVPPQNPITAAKVNLGKTLFWEEQLSSTRTVACATCHIPEAGGGDPRTLRALHPGYDARYGTPDDGRGSPGVIANRADGTYTKTPAFPLREQVTRRKALPAIMAAYAPLQFWDGRAGPAFTDPLTGQVLIPLGGELEEQAEQPPLSAEEMAHASENWPAIAARIAVARPLALASDVPAALAAWLGTRSYPELFQEAFGSREVTPARILMAIATYERILVPDQAPIDLFWAGNPNALTPQERDGMRVFGQVGRCGQCHTPPTFASPGFFNIGVRPWFEDRGRAEVTNLPADEGAFKIPSLRNVGLRAPFFHMGRFDDLRQVIDFYARGGDFHQFQTTRIQPFAITPQERDALLAFLGNALTDPRVRQGLPPFDHPRLYGGSPRMPASYGLPTPGGAGIPPRLVAVDPPVLANPRMTVGLGQGLGGARAVLLLDIVPANPPIRFLGADILVGLSSALLQVDLGALADSGAGEGYASRVFQVPGDPVLIGGSLYGQGLILDRGAPQGLAATQGVRWTFFGQ